jgi:hypothetical protein
MSNLYRGPSKDAPYQVSIHLAKRFQRRFFRNQPIRNKNGLWWPCLLTDRDEMSNLYREPDIDASYQVSVHLSKRFQRKRFLINSCAKSAWYARRQHSYNICKDFLSHNSWMKNLNFTNSCTINTNWNIYTIFIQLKTTFFEKSVKTINSNNSTKFEVNWWMGSQFTARHTKNCLQFDE